MRMPLARRSCRGQNIIEYILVVMVVVIVLIAGVLKGGAKGDGSGPLVDATKTVMSGPATLIGQSANAMCQCTYEMPANATCATRVQGQGCPTCETVSGPVCDSGMCCPSGACCSLGCCDDGSCLSFSVDGPSC